MAEVHNAEGLRPDEVHNAGEKPPQEIQISCTSEYQEYAFDEKHDIWGLVTLKAPCQADDENEEKRAPIDIVAVIDKSGSMSGTKLKLVKKTLEFILTQLTDRDRLSIITYDANVYLDFSLLNMTKENKDIASGKIQAIRDGSTTNLCGGLMKGLCQMIDRKEKNEVASVLLFTDGLANNGITSSAGIVAAMADPKRFDGPTRSNQPNARNRVPLQHQQQQQPHQSWLKNIFGSSKKTARPRRQQRLQQQQQPEEHEEEEEEEEEASSNINSTPSSSKSSGADYTVYTFGFGDDHDPDMLKEISDAGNGMYYYIENEDKIAESFGHCLGGLMSTVAQGIQLEITAEEGVILKEIHTAKPSEKISDKIIKVNMGDLQSEEKRDVVLELTIDVVPLPHNDTKQKLLTARVDYFNVITNKLASSTGELGVFRPEKIAVVHDESNMDRAVGQQRARVKMTSAMKKANKQAESGDLVGARQLLMTEIESSRARATTALDDDEMLAYENMATGLEDCVNNMGSASMYQAKGRKVQMNMVQQYDVQRSNNLRSDAFATRGKMKKRSMAKSFVSK